MIFDSNVESEILVDYPNMKYELFCNISGGVPRPEITWYKVKQVKPSFENFYISYFQEGVILSPSERITFANGNMILSFNRTQETDEGTYRCAAVNLQGTDSREGFLKFKGSFEV